MLDKVFVGKFKCFTCNYGHNLPKKPNAKKNIGIKIRWINRLVCMQNTMTQDHRDEYIAQNTPHTLYMRTFGSIMPDNEKCILLFVISIMTLYLMNHSNTEGSAKQN